MKFSFRKSYHEYSDEKLLQKIQQSDTAAFDELYQRYSQRLLFYFLRMLGNNQEKAEDFLQDLFVKVIDKSDLFRANARFSTWIFTIAHNMCKNEYRRMDVRKILDYDRDLDSISENPGEGHSSIESKMDNDRLKALIAAALENMDDNQRSTFVLRFQENLSVREISDILGCSEGTTKSRLFYVTKKLAKKFKAFDPKIHEDISHALK